MQMTILLQDGKRGTINLVSSSIIAEDFKANICKKLRIDANQFKLKIDFLNDEIELLAVDIIEKTIEPKANSLPVGVRLVVWNENRNYVYKNHMITLELDYMMELFNAQSQIKNDVVVDGSGRGSLGEHTKQINSIKDFKRYVDSQ